MVFTCPLISKSSRLFISPLGIVPCGPITIGITITFMCHSFFFQSLGRLIKSIFLNIFKNIYLSFCFFLILLGRQSPLFNRFSFFCWLSLGLVIWPRLGDLFEFQNPREVCASLSPGWILDCAYTTCSYGQIKISWWYYYYYQLAQSVGAVEYTDCFSAEGLDPPPKRVSRIWH